MKSADPLEKIIESQVCEYAKTLGVICYKFTSPNRRSVPDRLFVMPKGKGVFFIEFKRKGQQPTPSQTAEIAKIRAQGIFVGVVDNIAAGKVMVHDRVNYGI